MKKNMETQFIMNLKKLIKNDNSFYDEKKYKEIYLHFEEFKEENLKYLEKKLKKSTISKGKENLGRFYTINGFLKYLGENYNFTDNKIIEILKEEIDFQLKSEKPRNLSYILDILFSINKNDNEYYTEKYNFLKNGNRIFHDINAKFFLIFIEIKDNKYFLESFQRLIVDNIQHYYSGYIGKGFKYLNSLNEDFKIFLLKLFEYFNDKQVKKRLIKHYEYTSLILETHREDLINEIDYLFVKIEECSFSKVEYNKIYNFLYLDIQFALEHHQRNLLNNFFIDKLTSFLYKKDKKIIINILKNIDVNKHIFGIEKYIVKYLQLEDIDIFLELLKGKECENIIYYSYDYLLQSNKKDKRIEEFEKSKIFGKEIIERNKIIEENEKKIKKEKEKENEKERQEFKILLNLKKGVYSPKLFEKFLDYEEEEKKIKNIFSKKEIEELKKDLEKQVYTCLNYIKIKSYSKKSLELVHYEKTGESSFTHSRNVVYLELIIRISKIIELDLKKYYKTIVLFYPLLWGYEKLEYINEIIGNKLEEKDLDYILKVYSKDLHKNAIGLRFHHIQNLIDFYKKFSEKFNDKQNNKLEKICLEFFNISEEINVYEKEEFLKIYAKIGGEKKYRKIWNIWKKKYPNFNFFKTILINEENLDKKEISNFKFLVYINKILILNYGDKEGILWRINQIKSGNIEGEESIKIEYPNTSSNASYVNTVDSELGQWGNDEENFSYIFGKIPKVDIKKEILEILKQSFDIQKKLDSGKLEWKYELYFYYLRRIFFNYVLNLDESLVEKKFYYSVKDILSKYNYEITYNFDLNKLREKFGINDLEEEAIEYYNKGIDGIKNLLKGKYYFENELYKKIIPENTKEGIIRKEKDFILFVEGITDKIILENAWEKLYGNIEIPFIIENGFSSSQIGNNFRDEHYSFMDSDSNKTFIGMLDFDSAYKEFNGMQDKWRQKEFIENKGLLKKHISKNGYLFLLPIPIFRKEYANNNMGDKSLLNIELLFDDKILLEKNRGGNLKYLEKIEIPGNHKTTLYKFTKNKKFFSDNTFYLKRKDFENFKPIFKLIKNIIDGKYK